MACFHAHPCVRFAGPVLNELVKIVAIIKGPGVLSMDAPTMSTAEAQIAVPLILSSWTTAKLDMPRKLERPVGLLWPVLASPWPALGVPLVPLGVPVPKGNRFQPRLFPKSKGKHMKALQFLCEAYATLPLILLLPHDFAAFLVGLPFAFSQRRGTALSCHTKLKSAH